MMIALISQVISWGFQIYSHYEFEKKKPAFLQSLVSCTLSRYNNRDLAFTIAPFFVVIEFLFLLGYRPALKKRVQGRIHSHSRAVKLGKEK
jgi:uncharacterized membrane protein YGL010W